jgi:hypothetical protein
VLFRAFTVRHTLLKRRNKMMKKWTMPRDYFGEEWPEDFAGYAGELLNQKGA